jgi:iron complex outermembrane recepter protein
MRAIHPKVKYSSAAYILLLTVLVPPAAAQERFGSIAGYIKGPDAAYLPGTRVVARSTEAGTPVQVVAGSSGMYRLSNLQPGTYDLRVELEGFEPSTLSGVQIARGERKALDFTLQVATIREIVTVVGTAAKDSVEAVETRESSARDVGESLVKMPGVWKVRKGGIANDIVLRGFQGKDLNVLIDGQRIYGACPNNMDPAVFHADFAEVDRIEVASGPFDVKNQGSLGGVVNIITRRTEQGFHAVGNFSTGSYGYINPSATLSYGAKAFSVLGGYSYRLSSPYTDGSGKRFTEYVNYRADALDSDAFRIGTAWTKVSASPLPNHLVQFGYARQDADHVLYPYLQMDAIYDNADRFNAGYQIDDLSSFVRSLRVHGYFTQVHHWMTDEFRTSSAGVPKAFSMGTLAGTKAYGGRVETALRNVTVGVEAFRRQWDGTTQMAGSGYLPQYSIPDVETDSVGVYTEYTRALSDRVRLSLGGRIDTATSSADPSKANTNLYYAYNNTRSTSASNTFPSGNARVSYRAASGLEVHGGVGHTVRVPDPRERYFALRRMGTDWVGNPLLKPSGNTGVDAALTFKRQRLLLESTFYMNDISDYVIVTPKSKVNSIIGVMNSNARSYLNDDARIYGTELLLSFLLTPRVFFSSDLSYVRGSQTVVPELGILSSNLAEIPPMRSRNSLRYDTGRWFGEIEGVFVGPQDRVDRTLREQPTAGYGTANVRVGVSFKRFSVKFALNNLFDRQYYEHLSYQRDPFRSGARVYEPGGNLYANLSYRF